MSVTESGENREPAGGPFEAQPADMLLNGFARHSAKDAVEVIGRKAGDAGEFLEGSGPSRWLRMCARTRCTRSW